MSKNLNYINPTAYNGPMPKGYINMPFSLVNKLQLKTKDEHNE